MKEKTKKLLLTIMPIVGVALVAGIILIIVLSGQLNAAEYYKALSTSKYTKQVQTTTIYEGQALIYEKIETLVFDGGNVYHKIVERTLSSDYDKDYDETTAEYYYSAMQMYYYENVMWKRKTFDFESNKKVYDVKSSYLYNLKFDKAIKETATLKANVNDASINQLLKAETDYTSANIEITINNSKDVQRFAFQGKTGAGRNVSIVNQYLYNAESVTLPI